MGLKNLFVTQKPLTNVPNIPNDNNKMLRQEGETYTAYGTRICAKVNGADAVLEPCLQRIYLNEKRLQSRDEQLQAQKKDELRQRISEIDGKIAEKDVEKNHIDQQLKSNREQLAALHSDLVAAKNQDGTTNKMANVKMAIGLVILLILSVYLFVFYSSTFYSAFFKQFTFDTNVAEAMFDQQALPNALHSGIGGLIFILCAPIIFMGLGYVLHYYASERGKLKYLKILAILSITFIFDCILAYLIAKKIYDMEVLTKLGEFPEFSLSIAISDVNVWAVIFCGFITYMIWGFVFDLTISAYEEKKTNKKMISQITNNINRIKVRNGELEKDKSNLDREIVQLQSQKQGLQYKLSSNTFFFDELIIRTALTDFFTGWVTIMQPMGHPQEAQDDARRIFNQTIQSLFNPSN